MLMCAHAMQGWLDKEDEGYQAYGSEDEEDEDHIERAERFESAYNHRFEVQAMHAMVSVVAFC